MALNKWFGYGRFGKDPVLQVTNSGKNVVTVSIAVDRDMNKYANVNTTDWVSLVFWDEKAVNVNKFFKKGDEILVEGRLTSRKFEDYKGIDKTIFEVVVDRFYFVGARKNKAKQGAEEIDAGPNFKELAGDESELPF